MERIRTELPETDETNKPKNRRISQQTMPAWYPLLTPWRVVGGYLLVGLMFILLGAFLWKDATDVVELRYQYDGDESDGDECKISTYKENKTCTIPFNIDEDMSGPVHVYYELSNFYQNHATYVDSISSDQLLGTLTTDVSDDCTPLYQNGSLTLHPCGLIANTMFNDIFTVTSGQAMDESNIAWESDISDKFEQPDGFTSAACDGSDCATCLSSAGYTDSDGDVTFSGCDLHVDNGTSYAFYYPEEDTYQYLYETFPEVISPLLGVKDEHFIVWMRTAGLSKFRKLYGRIDDGLENGDTLNFTITSNFIVDYFDGTKSIVVSTTSSLGGRNTYWGQSFLTVGIILLVWALLIGVKHKLRPRPMGDVSKLLDDP